MDTDGSTLYDLYDEFEITPKVVNFALGTAGTDVKRKCLEVVRHIEDNLCGEFMTGVHCLVSPEFFDALTSHSKVKEAYERWQEGAALRDDLRSGFIFGGITFEEYRGQATDRISIQRASKRDRHATLFCNFKSIRVKDLGGVKQTPIGVVAGGKMYPHAFIANLGKNTGVYRRKTKKRFPLESVTIQIFDDAAKAIEDLVGTEAKQFFEKRFFHELKRVTESI